MVTRITDPGANATTREQAKALRKQEFKRPKTKAARTKLRTDRITAIKEAMGVGNDTDIPGQADSRLNP